MSISTVPLIIINPHTTTVAILDTYLGLVEPADGRSHSPCTIYKTQLMAQLPSVVVAQSVDICPVFGRSWVQIPLGTRTFFRVYLCMFQPFL